MQSAECSSRSVAFLDRRVQHATDSASVDGTTHPRELANGAVTSRNP
jgi:hypothetical protein